MFDAKSILENIVRGAAPSGSPQQSGGSLGDILNDILKGSGGGAGGTAGSPAGGSGGIGDILNQIGKSLSQAQAQAPAGAQPPSGQAAPSTSGPDLGDVLAQIKNKLGQAGGSVTDGGSIGDILGKVFSQATQGVKEGSSRIGEATGATDVLGRLAADPQAAQVLGKLKDLIQNNPYATRCCRRWTGWSRARDARGAVGRGGGGPARRYRDDRRPRVQGRAKLPSGKTAGHRSYLY